VVLKRLSDKTGHGYSADTIPHVEAIARLLDDGYTETDLRTVVWHRCRVWGDDPKMREYLRPKTLFARSNFADYLPAARAARAEWESEERKKGQPAAVVGLLGLEGR